MTSGIDVAEIQPRPQVPLYIPLMLSLVAAGETEDRHTKWLPSKAKLLKTVTVSVRGHGGSGYQCGWSSWWKARQEVGLEVGHCLKRRKELHEEKHGDRNEKHGRVQPQFGAGRLCSESRGNRKGSLARTARHSGKFRYYLQGGEGEPPAGMKRRETIWNQCFMHPCSGLNENSFSCMW